MDHALLSILSDPNTWLSLVTLTALEIVLGVDNIIFIAILVGRVEERSRKRARMLGLSLAMVSRIVLLFSLNYIMQLTKPWFELLGHEVSGRDLILVLGGLFLMWKSVHEIHGSLETGDDEGQAAPGVRSLASVLVQITLLDLVFSLDSVITAVGLAEQLGVMVTAIVVAVGVMLLASGAIARFVDTHPTIKMLALSFLMLVAVTLLADGLGFHIPKGYIYFAMAFSVGVEMLNLRARKVLLARVEPRAERKSMRSENARSGGTGRPSQAPSAS